MDFYYFPTTFFMQKKLKVGLHYKKNRDTITR